MKTSVSVNFTKNNTNKKDETVFEFQVRGKLSDEQIVKLARLKSAGEVFIDIRTSQVEIEDYDQEEPREGLRGTIDPDGSVNLDEGQLTMEEVESAEAEETVQKNESSEDPYTDTEEKDEAEPIVADQNDDPMAGVDEESDDELH